MVRKNHGFEFDGACYRVLRGVSVDDDFEVQMQQGPATHVWCIDIDDPFAWPVPFSVSHVSLLPVVDLPLAARNNLNDVEVALRDRAWKLLDGLINSVPFDDLCCDSKRNAAIERYVETLKERAEQARKLGYEADVASKPTLYKWLRRYFQRGLSPAALVPDYSKCGRPQVGVMQLDKALGFRAPEAGSKEDVEVTAGRGAASQRGIATFQMKGVDLDNMRSIVDGYLAKTTRFKLPGAYRELKSRFYSREDGNDDSHHLPEGEYPSLRQFRYFYEKNYDHAERKKHRKSQREIDLNDHPLLGAASAKTRGPGYVYEVDATVLECHVVTDQPPYEIVSKPTLYLITDRWSQLIVGYALTFEKPSWAAALLALLSLYEDKEELCKRYGVKYVKAEWPAHGVVPHQILADRGTDWANNASMAIARDLGSIVDNLPAGQATMKPIVECHHKLVNEQLRKFEPSSDPDANKDVRQKIDYKNEACATEHLMHRYVLEAIRSMNRKVRRNFPSTPAMLSQRVITSPISLWEYGMTSVSGELGTTTEEKARLLLLPKGKGVVTEKGICFEGVYFRSKEAEAARWFDEGHRSSFSVDVSYYPGSVEAIYVHPREKRGGTPHVAYRSARSAQYRGLSFAQVKRFEKLRKQAAAEAQDLNDRIDAEFIATVRPLAEERAKVVKEATKGMSRASRKKNSKANREVALAKGRIENPVVRPLEGDPSAAAASPSRSVPPLHLVTSTPPAGASHHAAATKPSPALASSMSMAARNAAMRAHFLSNHKLAESE